jgi:hypothetical protein
MGRRLVCGLNPKVSVRVWRGGGAGATPRAPRASADRRRPTGARRHGDGARRRTRTGGGNVPGRPSSCARRHANPARLCARPHGDQPRRPSAAAAQLRFCSCAAARLRSSVGVGVRAGTFFEGRGRGGRRPVRVRRGTFPPATELCAAEVCGGRRGGAKCAGRRRAALGRRRRRTAAQTAQRRTGGGLRRDGRDVPACGPLRLAVGRRCGEDCGPRTASSRRRAGA